MSRFFRDPYAEAPREPTCEWPGCNEVATHRAPLSPKQIHAYRWFCLDHVRAYNASWNYYDGMDEAQIEQDRRFDTVWRRPSWRLGARLAGGMFSDETVRDDFGVFGDGAKAAPRTPRTREEEALMVLDLRPPVSVADVKARYKVLVKLHHPDANGGDKDSEERFKAITAAYHTVLETLVP